VFIHPGRRGNHIRATRLQSGRDATGIQMTKFGKVGHPWHLPGQLKLIGGVALVVDVRDCDGRAFRGIRSRVSMAKLKSSLAARYMSPPRVVVQWFGWGFSFRCWASFIR